MDFVDGAALRFPCFRARFNRKEPYSSRRIGRLGSVTTNHSMLGARKMLGVSGSGYLSVDQVTRFFCGLHLLPFVKFGLSPDRKIPGRDSSNISVPSQIRS